MILSVTNSTFSDNLLRLASFASFPRSCPLYFSRLSSAGFTYTGKDDIVSCSACDLHIGNWNGKEIPLLVHRQNSPSCPMIKGMLVNKEYQYSNNKSLQCAEDVSKVMETSDFEKCKSTDSAKEFQQSTKKTTDHWRKSDKATDHWRKSDRTSFDSTGSDNNIDGLNGGHSYESGYISQSPVSAENISSPSLIPNSSPRYPHNAILCERLKTFNTWSRDLPQSPENLARAGFFYTGTNDLVRCFHCGGGLTSWEAEDNPWVEHAHWFPQCVFLRQNKGEEFIQLISSMVDQLAVEQQNQQLAISDTLPVIVKSNDVNTNSAGEELGATANIEQLISVRSVREMGYTMEDIIPAYTEVVSHHKTDKISAVQLMEKIFEIEERKNRSSHGENQTVETPITGQHNMQVTDETNTATGSNTPDDQMACVQYETTAGKCKEPTNTDYLYPDLLLCKVCMEEQVSIAFLPCGHLSTCGQCAPAMKKCPICRKHVKGSLKTYLS